MSARNPMGETTTELRRTPLEAEHRALGARLGPFAGWLMPIEYEGTLAEHRAVRGAVGLFDLTHLGKVIVEGDGALALLQGVLSNDVARVAAGAAQYNLVLNDRGGIVDDLLVYRLGEARYLLVPNAANTAQVHQALLGRRSGGAPQVVLREDLAIVAPQGPASAGVVEQLFPETADLAYMRVTEGRFHGHTVVLSRSGYTGERGFELFVPEARAVELWRELLSRGESMGIRPAGLGARDTLRLEMGYPLHGNDISPERTPLEAGLSWAVAFDKGDFTGRDALARRREEGVPSKLWGLRMRESGKIPRAHYAVMQGGRQVGETTSGTFSPTLGIGIAMAYLSPPDGFHAGDEVEVDIRGRRGGAGVVRPPFVDSSPK